MSFALQIPEPLPAGKTSAPPYKLTETELRLRNQFVVAFNDAPQSDWEVQIAVWDLTDELKSKGELAEGVVKRIHYVAAIPNSFHFRVGYKEWQSRLAGAVEKAVSVSIARYYAGERG